jgi:glycerate kinase
LLTLPNVVLKAGVQIVIEAVNLAEAIRDADLVITGEGRMDAQSAHGKAPIGVAGVAKQFGKPVIAIVGCLREDYEVVYQHGIDAVFPIIRQLGTLDTVLANGRYNLISAAQNIAKLYQMNMR